MNSTELHCVKLECVMPNDSTPGKGQEVTDITYHYVAFNKGKLPPLNQEQPIHIHSLRDLQYFHGPVITDATIGLHNKALSLSA